ncbi:hypothetical protein [Legionella fairfieldensis]|uniref:hypothetical protein n=1 Tax=Legionella fairfieldensis TaxID=45064 RepID=UPI000685146B|nr:hypothetical protein [Legionella fairfieldensis]
MPFNNEDNNLKNETDFSLFFIPSSRTLYTWTWNVLNFTTVAGLTSAAILTIQSPIKTILLNFTKNGAFIPSFTGGTLAFFRAIYAGTTPALSGSLLRTAYVTGIKNDKVTEETNEEKSKGAAKINPIYIAFVSLGNVLITQIPNSLYQLKQLEQLGKLDGHISNGFKWHTLYNVSRLMSGGFAVRYVAGLVDFTSLFLVEEDIAKKLPFENKKTNHFVAGALSGMIASFFSSPLTMFYDYTLIHAKVINGKLINKSAFSILKEIKQEFINNPKLATRLSATNIKKQLPVRMGLTAGIFSIVAGMGEVLGNEPLKKMVPEKFQPSQRFFAANAQENHIYKETIAPPPNEPETNKLIPK